MELLTRSFEKILDVCYAGGLAGFANSCLNSSAVQSADNCAILAALVAAKLKKEGTDSDEEGKLGLCSAMLSVLGASKNFEVQVGINSS